MQMVGAVVYGQAVFFSVHSELAFANAVGISAYQSAQERFWTVDEFFDAVVPLNNIGHPALSIGNHDGHYGTTVICDANFNSFIVLQDKQIRLFAFY
jgi:hypothetical protein